MNHAAVVTSWVLPDGNPAHHPRVSDDHALAAWEDITGQPTDVLIPDPNAYTVLVTCSDAVLADLESDPNAIVLWSEVIDEES